VEIPHLVREALLRTLLVGAGGFFGAGTRYWLGELISARSGPGFPWATFVINVTGSLLLGLLLPVALERLREPAGDTLRLLAGVGFLGAYTTFSTFSYETLQLAARGQWLRAAAYSLGSVVLGLSAAAVGVRLVGRG
jgi:CrcB protein